MALSEKQKTILSSFEVRRARDFDPSVLRAMTGPIIAGKERKCIIELFTSDQYLQDDIDGHLASYVIFAPTGMPLAFFSLRCGELFERIDFDKLTLSQSFFKEISSCMDNPHLSEEIKRNKIKQIAERMNDNNLSLDDIIQLNAKKSTIQKDKALEVNKDVTRVREVHPAIEIKFLGTNASARSYWKSLGFPDEMKMGETLFWIKVVDVIHLMMNNVGCEYVYIFAADEEAEGVLVQYYRRHLNFGSNSVMSANKPHFDYMSQFLFQSVKDLFSKQTSFIEKIGLQKKSQC